MLFEGLKLEEGAGVLRVVRLCSASRAELLTHTRAAGFRLLKVRPVLCLGNFGFSADPWVLSGTLSRQLSNLLNSSYDLHGALLTLQQRGDYSEYEQGLIGSLRLSLQAGRRFSEALEGMKGVFPTSFRWFVYLGEETGALAVLLERYAEVSAWVAKSRAAWVERVLYPGLRTLGCLGASGLLAAYQAQVTGDLGQFGHFATPWWGQGYLWMAVGIRRVWKVRVGLLPLVAWVGWKLWGNPGCVWPLFSRVWGVQRLARLHDQTLLAYSLGSLGAVGRPTPDHLIQLQRHWLAPGTAARILIFEHRLRRGERVAEALQGAQLFSPADLGELRISEELGDSAVRLHRIAERIATFASFRLDRMSRRIQAALQALMLLNAGLLAATLYLPLLGYAEAWDG